MAKIALDAGHGRFTPGKRCWKAIDPNETREWVLNSRIASYVDAHLKRCGVSTMRVDDTTGQTDVSLSKRVKKANDWKADLYLSIHANAGLYGKHGGGIANYSHAGSKRSAKLRDILYKHMIAETGLKGNRSNPCTTANFYVIRKTTMAACLMECGFMDSLDDTPIILTDAFARKCALGIAKGACEYLGIKFVDGNAPSKPTPAPTPSKPVAPPKPSKPSGNYTGNSIVEYLNSIGKNSSFHARRIYAAQYGIKNYTGTASQNTQLLNAMRGNNKPTASSYYPAFNSTSIVDGLKKIGVDNSFANRKKIAKANGIGNYKGTSSQNNKLCNLARKGKLKKA